MQHLAMRLNKVLFVIYFILLSGCTMTVDRYAKEKLPAIKKNASKIVTTKYYEGVYRYNKWICGKEIEPGADYDGYLLSGEHPSVEYYNKAGNIILYVETRSDKPIRFVETSYISQDDSRIDFKRYVSRFGGDIKEIYIRDKEQRLIKIKSKNEETEYEYDSKGQRTKIVTTSAYKKTIWKQLPGKAGSYSILEYNLSWDNYKDGLEEERLEIHGSNNNLIEKSSKYYDDSGQSWGSSKRLYKYVGSRLQEETYYQHANDDSTWEKFTVKYNTLGNVSQEDFEIMHTAGYHPQVFSRLYQYKYNSKRDWTECTRVMHDYSEPPTHPEKKATIIVREIIYK